MFDQDTADRVCARLADGESLRSAAKAEGSSARTILNWVESNAVFSTQYTHARTRGYMLLADEIIEISDDSDGDIIDTEHGPKVDAERVARSKLRVDSRKWMLSKMLPKVFGDKIEHDHKGGINLTLSSTENDL